MKKLGLLVLAIALLLRGSALAMTDAEEQERMSLVGGPWHAGKNVPCSSGVVTSVHPRLEEPKTGGRYAFDSGVVVEFRLPAAPKFLNQQPLPLAAVVHYEGDTSNRLMQSEKPGDRVQVCLVSFPTPTRDLSTGKSICDPNVDPRGFVYRVYDYARRAAYIGPDSQHSCGGA